MIGSRNCSIVKTFERFPFKAGTPRVFHSNSVVATKRWSPENERLEPKIHPIEKENHLNQTSIFGFQMFIFQGVTGYEAAFSMCATFSWNDHLKMDGCKASFFFGISSWQVRSVRFDNDDQIESERDSSNMIFDVNMVQHWEPYSQGVGRVGSGAKRSAVFDTGNLKTSIASATWQGHLQVSFPFPRFQGKDVATLERITVVILFTSYMICF